jgi:hypothetical protein
VPMVNNSQTLRQPHQESSQTCEIANYVDHQNMLSGFCNQPFRKPLFDPQSQFDVFRGDSLTREIQSCSPRYFLMKLNVA